MLQPEGRNERLSNDHPKNHPVQCIIFFWWQKTWLPEKKTEGISKIPHFLSFAIPEFGDKKLSTWGWSNRWWFGHPRQRIQVEHLCFFLEKKTRYLKQPQILVLFLLQPFSCCFKTSSFKKTKKKKAPPSIKSNHPQVSVFFFRFGKMNPSPRCQSRSPDHTLGAINSRSRCRSERALEGYPSPGFFVVEVTTKLPVTTPPETLKLTGNGPPWK